MIAVMTNLPCRAAPQPRVASTRTSCALWVQAYKRAEYLPKGTHLYLPGKKGRRRIFHAR